MSAKTLLQTSFDNCLLVRNALTHRDAESELAIALVDCMEKLETVIQAVEAQGDWDAEGFQSFMAQFHHQQRIRRELAVVTHLNTPLLPILEPRCVAIAST